MAESYIVYILRCRDGTLYTGITTDLRRRFTEHKAGTASKYTRARGAMRMVYAERCGTRSAALRREAAIKKFTRTEKLKLIRRGVF